MCFFLRWFFCGTKGPRAYRTAEYNIPARPRSHSCDKYSAGGLGILNFPKKKRKAAAPRPACQINLPTQRNVMRTTLGSGGICPRVFFPLNDFSKQFKPGPGGSRILASTGREHLSPGQGVDVVSQNIGRCALVCAFLLAPLRCWLRVACLLVCFSQAGASYGDTP